jgi:ATP-dependent DNA helicase PIF1
LDRVFSAFDDRVADGTERSVDPVTDSDGNTKWVSTDTHKWIGLPETVVTHDAEDRDAFIKALEWIHPDVSDYETISKSAVLCATHRHAIEINDIFRDKLPGESVHRYSRDTFKGDVPLSIRAAAFEYLNALTMPGMPPHDLELKKDMICFLMRNISKKNKLNNGTVVRILEILSNTVLVYVFKTKKSHYIPKIYFEANIPGSKMVVSRFQFPLCARYAMTDHAVQGKTLHRVLLDLRQQPFCHGQLHVAISRVRLCADIRALSLPENITEKGTTVVINVVYSELVDDLE